MKFNSFLIIILTLYTIEFSNAQIINDPLQNSTIGTQSGGIFTSDGYQPGLGENHIYYNLPAKIINGYVEFEVKGFNPDALPVDEDHAFIVLYDKRGITEPLNYFTEFKFNFFRWNFHWRQNRAAFKGVMNCAAPTDENINSPIGYWIQEGEDDPRDWNSEPTGTGITWNQSTWYKIKIEWNNRQFKAYVNNSEVWSTSGPYDYAPEELGIWLGSGPYKYDADVSNVTYRNFKLYDLGGTVSDYLGISPSSQTVSSSAGSTNLSVASNVSWSINDNVSWLTLSPTSGTSNRTITASYSQNNTTSSRTATITVTGSGITRTATITQSGATSTNYLAVSPDSLLVPFDSDSTTFNISSNVSWSITENEDWLSLSPSSGSNNSTITAYFDINNSNTIREAEIIISGGGFTRNIFVVQNGLIEFIEVFPDSQKVSSSSGEITFQINSNVNWNIETDVDWLNFSAADSSGNVLLTVSYLQNVTDFERTANIFVKNDSLSTNLKITQEASNLYLRVNPEMWSVSRSAGSVTFVVESNLSWEIENKNDWINTSFQDSINNASFTAFFTSNTDTSHRTGKIYIKGSGLIDSVMIDQSGSTPYEISSISVPITGGFVVGEGIYGQGSSVTLRAIPIDGWKFDNWMEDSTIISVDSILTITVDTARTFIANFSLLTNVTSGLGEIPKDYQLSQNYPNPFNPSTIISFALPKRSEVKIVVYDLLGNIINVLADGNFEGGYHNLSFSSDNLPSGIYFYTINAGSFVETKKMILLK